MSQIRSVQISDVSQVLDIYAHYINTTPIAFEREVPNLESYCERVEYLSENAPFLVYETDGKIEGFTHAALSEEPGDHWTFESTVYVSPTAHRKGIGSALYGQLFKLLRAQGAVNIFASITLPNEASRRLHERFGFSDIGTSRKIGFKHDQWWDVLWVQLRLQDFSAPRDLKRPVRGFRA